QASRIQPRRSDTRAGTRVTAAASAAVGIGTVTIESLSEEPRLRRRELRRAGLPREHPRTRMNRWRMRSGEMRSPVYTPRQNEETRVEVMHALIHSHPLGTWVSLGDGELTANHVPFEVDRTRGEFGTLVGHVARANPVWKQAPTGVRGLVTFQ